MNVEFTSGNELQRWQRAHSGPGIVVVVFDDFYKRRESRSIYARGLKTIERCLLARDEVIALGFFPLPETQAEVITVINTARDWVQQCPTGATEVVFLVDMYLADAEAAIGVDLVESLARDHRTSFGQPARIGILSVSGVPQEELAARPWLSDYPVFDKHSLQNELSVDLLEFLGFNDDIGRIWPISAREDGGRDYSRWFTLKHPVVPHNWSDATPAFVAEAFREYLNRVLGFPSPTHWLEGEELRNLHSELKCFVGSCSTCHTGGRRNLTLGGLLLLFGAAIGSQAEALVASVNWTEENTQNVILPDQSIDAARNVVMTLVSKSGLFRLIARHDETGQFIVSKAKLSGNAFTIEAELDPDVAYKDRASLLRKVLDWGDADGTAYGAYKRFLVTSAVALTGREARCVLNLKMKPKSEGGNSMVLEFRRCAS